MQKLIVTYEDGVITRLDLADVIAVEERPVVIGLDDEAHAALLEERDGEDIAQSDFAALCGVFAYLLVVLTPSGLAYLDDSTLLLDVPANAIDICESWRSGKYMVEKGAIVPNPAWHEPTIHLGPVMTIAPDGGDGQDDEPPAGSEWLL